MKEKEMQQNNNVFRIIVILNKKLIGQDKKIPDLCHFSFFFVFSLFFFGWTIRTYAIRPCTIRHTVMIRA